MTAFQESFGKYLRTERELRRISLDEIAHATKIKLEYLHALEEDRFDTLPNDTFVKGYIRAYAKYCGLNEDEVAVNYEYFDQQAEETTLDAPPSEARFPQHIWLYSGIVIIIILILIILSIIFGNAPLS